MNKMLSVYTVSSELFGVDDMFRKRGWQVYRDYSIDNANTDPDLICFTGGSDINPAIYGEKPAGCDQWNPKRDAFEIEVFKKYAGKVPIVGICRGGQLVNCLNGGRLWQHVDNHGRSHYLHTVKGDKIFVTSTHHQMMVPAADHGVVLAWATLSTVKIGDNAAWSTTQRKPEDEPDAEVIYYSRHKHLCFQPHPEYGVESCEKYFFDLVHKYLVA